MFGMPPELAPPELAPPKRPPPEEFDEPPLAPMMTPPLEVVSPPEPGLTLSPSPSPSPESVEPPSAFAQAMTRKTRPADAQRRKEERVISKEILFQRSPRVLLGRTGVGERIDEAVDTCAEGRPLGSMAAPGGRSMTFSRADPPPLPPVRERFSSPGFLRGRTALRARIGWAKVKLSLVETLPKYSPATLRTFVREGGWAARTFVTRSFPHLGGGCGNGTVMNRKSRSIFLV